MEHRLIIEKFGKIERAVIQAAPFTLFVGDNNSGKSYLLSLLWGIYSEDEWSVLFEDLEEQKLYREICERISSLVLGLEEGPNQEIRISSEKLLKVLNNTLDRNKDRFVSGIFNAKQVSIQKLSVEIPEKFDLSIKIWQEKNRINVSYHAGKSRLSFPKTMMEDEIEFASAIICKNILLWLLKGESRHHDKSNVVYFPAARTGFMLAKNIINKVGRQKTFDVSEIYGRKEEEMEPFTKPIIRFLDALEELSLEHKTQYGQIVTWIEENMTHGVVQYNKETGNEIRYVPEGSRVSLPLRTSSAVITELTPLLLLLKYKQRLRVICYEEPEMCLHPQLQQEMGRLLIRLVNSGISMIATTHSDIIIQHINNMCRMYEMDVPEKLMENLGIDKEDVISIQDVAVYQLTDRGTHSVVDRIPPTDGEFKVETFTNALMKILAQTSEVQDFEGE